MENPQTWGPVERVIDTALRECAKSRAEGSVGLSRAAYIAKALREAGLIDGLGVEAEMIMDGRIRAERIDSTNWFTESGLDPSGQRWTVRDGG